ncbi:MAG: helix-turn-helix domain-containing protein [Patescibacteria group bacterium]
MARQRPQTDTTTRTLQGLGLGEDTALLYTQMLNHPRSTVQELGTRAPFPRTMLYYLLKQLVQRGLVTARKEGWRTVYVAEDPERLYDILTSKEKEFERETHSVRELIPRLKHRYRLAGKRPSVRMFEGVEEYQKALEDIIVSRPKEISAYEMLGAKKPALEIRETHERRRIARKIQKKVLFFEDSDALQFLKTRGYDDYTQFRTIREELIAPFGSDVTLYDGKLLYTSYYDEREPTAILVEDQALYGMQKNIFEALWKQGKDRTLAFTKSL